MSVHIVAGLACVTGLRSNIHVALQGCISLCADNSTRVRIDMRAQEFFLTVKSLLRRTADSGPDSYAKWGSHEAALNDKSVCDTYPLCSCSCLALKNLEKA